jgi:hypothetical protein
MKAKKKGAKKMLVLSLVCIIILSIAIYFILGNFINRIIKGYNFPERGNQFPFNASDKGGNFQPPQSSLSDEEKSSITSFFENSPSSTEVDAYCKEDKPYCLYYCIEMRGDDEFCKEFLNNTQMRSRGGQSQ